MTAAPSAETESSLRTLLIDNYDSFTFNLFHYLAEVNGREPVVVPNDWVDWDPSILDSFDNVVIAPGPGTPDRDADFGICAEVLRVATIPILGICLGHQGVAIGEGGIVAHAPVPMHGRTSIIVHDGRDLFAGLPSPLTVVRYHSLAVTEVPASLEVTARTEDGVVMGLRHRTRPQWGVQFHPESILTEQGLALIRNFAGMTRRFWSGRGGSRDGTVVNQKVTTDKLQTSTAEPRTFLLHSQELPLRTTSVNVFSAVFAGQSERVWLDGNMPDNLSSRFSIMGAPTGPLSRIARANIATGTVEVRFANGVEVVESGFFDWLDADLAAIQLAEAGLGSALPFEFRLGWVGYLGYELKAELGSPAAGQSDLPDAVMMFLDRAVVIDRHTNTIYLLALSGEGVSEVECGSWFDEVSGLLSSLDARVDDNGDEYAGPGNHELSVRHERSDYLDRIAAAQRLITDGESYEVCLTTMIDTPWVADPLDTYRQLRRDNPTPFGAFLTVPEVSVLSSSPERFVRITADGTIESKPIKGTRPRGNSLVEDEALKHNLKTSEKDLSENLMIVDLVRHDLGRSAELGSVSVDALFDIETYATVHQLVSTIKARLAAEYSAVNCIRAAFPPGSMTGAPKTRTMSIINELEGGPRGVYSGAIGYFSLNGAVDLSVLIRTAVIGNGRLRYGVGGAITALSDPVDEYEETMVKARPLFKLIGDGQFPGQSSNEELVP